MLGTLLGYARGLGVEVDWVVISGDSEFFAITKRIHNGLYGSPGDGGALGAAERAHYDRITAENAERLRRIVRSGESCSSMTRSRRASSLRSSSSGHVPFGVAMSASMGRTSGRSAPGRSSVPTSRLRMRTCSRARHSRRAGSTRVVARDSSLHRSVRAQEPRPNPVRGARSAQRGRATRSRRDLSRRARAATGAGRPRGTRCRSEDPARRPGLSLGQNQGHGRRARKLRATRRRESRTARACRACRELRLGRPRG